MIAGRKLDREYLQKVVDKYFWVLQSNPYELPKGWENDEHTKSVRYALDILGEKRLRELGLNNPLANKTYYAPGNLAKEVFTDKELDKILKTGSKNFYLPSLRLLLVKYLAIHTIKDSLDGLTQEEICKKYNIPKSTLIKRLNTLKKNFKEE